MTTGFAELRDEPPGRHAREDRDDRQREERERDERRDEHDPAAERRAGSLASRRKPAARSFVCAAWSQQLRDECPRRGRGACSTRTTATAYWTIGCALQRMPIVADLAVHGPRVGRVDEAGVGLPERDLASTSRTSVSLLTTFVRTRRRDRGCEHLARVVADRHAGRRHDELDAVCAEVVDLMEVRRVRPRDDQDQRVAREDDGLLDEPLVVELLRDPVFADAKTSAGAPCLICAASVFEPPNE